MIAAWKRFDRLCLDAMDDFVVHLQSVFRIGYTSAVTGFCLCALAVAALAGVASFRGSFEWMRAPASVVWSVLALFMVASFSRTYWRDGRNWGAAQSDYWRRFAHGLRRRTEIGRPVLLMLPLFACATVPLDLADGRLLPALRTVVWSYLPFVTLLLIVYALCAPPRMPGADRRPRPPREGS